MEVNHHVLQIEFEFRYPPSIFGKIMSLGLSKFQGWNSFSDFFPKCLPILTWFLACKSITMIYRSSLSFVTLYWFLAKLRALDLVNFSNQTVFQTFFTNASRYWPEFWHVSQSPWFTDWAWVSLPSMTFGRITGLGLSTVQRSNSFADFFSKRVQILTCFLACKSIIMTYTSTWSFVAPHWFFAELVP